MNKFIFKLLLIFTTTVITIFASQKDTDDIAKIGAVSLYNINKVGIIYAYFDETLNENLSKKKDIALLTKENKWVKDHPIIKIAITNYWTKTDNINTVEIKDETIMFNTLSKSQK